MSVRMGGLLGWLPWLLCLPVGLIVMPKPLVRAQGSAPRILSVETVGYAAVAPDSVEAVSVVGVEELRTWAIKDAIFKAVEWALRKEGLWPGAAVPEGGVSGAVAFEAAVPEGGVSGAAASEAAASEAAVFEAAASGAGPAPHRAGPARIEAAAQKAVSDYTVLESAASDGTLMVRVEAKVDLDQLAAAGLDRLRLLLILNRDPHDAPLDRLPQELRSALADHLLSSGIQLLEPLRGEGAARDAQALADLGRQHRADALLILDCRGREKDRMGEFIRMEYIAQARLAAGYSGQPLGERRFHSEPPRNVMTEDMELDAARELAADLGPFVLDVLGGAADRAVVRRVRLCGLSGRWQAEQVRSALERQADVRRVRVLLYEEDAAACAYLEAEMNARMRDRLGFVLERIQGTALRVTGESPSWIEAEVL